MWSCKVLLLALVLGDYTGQVRSRCPFDDPKQRYPQGQCLSCTCLDEMENYGYRTATCRIATCVKGKNYTLSEADIILKMFKKTYTKDDYWKLKQAFDEEFILPKKEKDFMEINYSNAKPVPCSQEEIADAGDSNSCICYLSDKGERRSECSDE